jgi:hypothetical protein
MKQYLISGLLDYVKFIQEECSKSSCFRGVSDSSYELLPSIGRNLAKGKTIEEVKIFLEKNEINAMRIFRTSSFQFHKYFDICELELLAIAQHHGLKTRLLDWTKSALVALFFAIEKNLEDDGAVYIFNDKPKIRYLDGPIVKSINPYKMETNSFFMPMHSTSRITAQQGLFLIFSKPYQPYTHSELIKILIPKDCKISVRRSLSLLGINHGVLFPDLDGLSKHLNWLKYE